MVFNQKLGKPITFTKLPKNAQGYCQPNKDSVCYNVSLNTHDADHFHHPQILKLASGTYTEGILNRHKKHNEIFKKSCKEIVTKTKHSISNKLTFYTSIKSKSRNISFRTKFFIQKRNSKNYKVSEKDSFK